MLSILDKGSKSIFKSFRKKDHFYFYQRSSSFGYKDYPLWDIYAWQNWELQLKVYDLIQARGCLRCLRYFSNQRGLGLE